MSPSIALGVVQLPLSLDRSSQDHNDKMASRRVWPAVDHPSRGWSASPFLYGILGSVGLLLEAVGRSRGIQNRCLMSFITLSVLAWPAATWSRIITSFDILYHDGHPIPSVVWYPWVVDASTRPHSLIRSFSGIGSNLWSLLLGGIRCPRFSR